MLYRCLLRGMKPVDGDESEMAGLTKTFEGFCTWAGCAVHVVFTRV